ncbi:MAG TPA: glycosyl hydrolase family 18 protein [bacterium]|nr:glycosyl hydrolase family 18 protein [bacterium]HPN42991.1 glycosyl hydrolase family 18 protein [bacterium]
MSLKKTILAVLPIFFIILFLLPATTYTETIVAGYYPSWQKSTLAAQNLAMNNLTHVIHSFVIPGSDGLLNYDADFIYPQLNTKVHAAGKKITFALGGWGGSDGFPVMAASAQSRETFINNIITFCLRNNYDGVDIDWEHPANAADKKNLVSLVKEMRAAFNTTEQNLIISMAVTAGSWAGQWIDYDSLTSSIDWFGCMTYDFHGSWTDHAGHNSPLYSSGGDQCGSVNEGYYYLTGTRGVPKEKILIGIPFYGRQFNASLLYGPATGGTDLNFCDIFPLIGNGWTRYWDNVAQAPYLLNTSRTLFITYDDSTSVTAKFKYALDKKIAGVMIWALGGDVISDQQPLLNAIGQIATGVESKPRQVDTFGLLQNYPNPFNASSVICYEIFQTLPVRIDVFDTNGRLVSNLVDSIQPPQRHNVRFYADNLPSGIYLYKLSTPEYDRTGKMILIK